MKAFYRQKSLLFFLLICTLAAGAQVKFTVSVSPEIVGKDEYAQLKLMVENATDLQQINPPDLKNFTVVSGPSQESGMSMVNGFVKKYIALNYILKPKVVGSFKIPPATARIDGKVYRSSPVAIKVVAQPTGNSAGGNLFSNPFAGFDPFAESRPEPAYKDYILRKGEDPQDKIRKNMFVKLEVDKTTCFVGEPIVATYKLFTRLKSESNMVKNPSLNGFSVIDLQQAQDMSYHIEKLDGRPYNVYNIRKIQLYPLLPGSVELGAAEVENKVSFVKEDYLKQQQSRQGDIFQDLQDNMIPAAATENFKIILQNKPLIITVKPLPEANKPADFKGAVGKFSIAARVQKDNFTTDDAGKLALIINGSGNLQMINAPVVNWPAGMDGFDAKATEELNKTTIPVSGRKIFEYPFTVAAPGTYTIPSLSYSYFDIESKRYKNESTQPVTITVSKGSGIIKKNAMQSVDSKNEPSWLIQFFGNRLRVISLIAALVIIGLITWLKTDQKKHKFVLLQEQNTEVDLSEPDSEVEETVEIEQNPFEETAMVLSKNNASSFYTVLNHDLKRYLTARLQIPPEDLSKKMICEVLDEKGVPTETCMHLTALMDEIDWQLYTPYVDNKKMAEMYNRAIELTQLINTYYA